MSEALSAAADFKRGVAAARADEAERCALLNEMLAGMHERSAAKIRKDGSFTVRAVWPLLKKHTVVSQRWEQRARDVEAAAHSLRTVAKCIREGFDPRTLPDSDGDKPPGACYCDLDDAACRAAGHYKPAIWSPCPVCSAPMDCASWKCCERGHQS